MAGWLEEAWLERYLARQLNEAETDWFEAYILDKPVLLEQVEIDSDVRDGFSQGFDSMPRQEPGGSSAPYVSDAPIPGPAGSRKEGSVVPIRDATRAVRIPASARWLAVAATVVFAVGIGWLGRASYAPSRENSDVVVNPTRMVYDTMRGEATLPEVQHAGSPSQLLLVEVGVPSAAQQISLELPDRPGFPLAVSPDGFVSFLLERSSITKYQTARIRYQLDGREVLRNIDLRPQNEGAQ